jgi:hypothetical protein
MGGAEGLGWTVEVYNPVTDTWTRGPEMLNGRSLFAASALNGRIYAIGGDSAWVEMFDPAEPFAVRQTGKRETTWGEEKSR